MTTLWLSYAWKDNKDSDVDFIAQELVKFGVTVKLDRWNINAGKRLWEQIENFIQNPEECDGWVLFATQNSLGSGPCREEFAYALDRAINTRGSTFPVIGLFSGTVDKSLIPAGIKTRLYISITDPDWKERIKASLDGKTLNLNKPNVEPYQLIVHEINDKKKGKFAIEVRPRAGTWSPFLAAIPAIEKESVSPSILFGVKTIVPENGVLFNTNSCISEDGLYWCMIASNEASPTQSYYIFCKNLPKKLIFGVNGNGQLQYPFIFNK